MDKLTENTKTSSPSSLQLAFLGDAVYELYVREHVLDEISGHVDKLNKASKKLSMAVTQAKIADLLVKEEKLREEELSVFKRGRNAKSASLPKSCTPAEYRKATGLEALMGYLFLTDQKDRIRELLEYGIEHVN
ncbi:MAG: ribonuclease III [Lachnospiraceae bacterium]|nr:ribonuclease III [Lachnospiraceae bacterium]